MFSYSSWRGEVAGETGCLLVVSCCFSSVIWLDEGMIHLNLSQLLVDKEGPQQIIGQGDVFSLRLLYYLIELHFPRNIFDGLFSFHFRNVIRTVSLSGNAWT